MRSHRRHPQPRPTHQPPRPVPGRPRRPRLRLGPRGLRPRLWQRRAPRHTLTVLEPGEYSRSQ
ncbi:hypothetical protein DQ226_14650 [Dietzia maris]|uniref:Uncharacterized protein n=1 Tax=Dietzia maris TaxID=37915 RepID=A0A365P7F6_9ACTN|nr:hypothetical protein DQ226_14650 [Dietzia maris]